MDNIDVLQKLKAEKLISVVRMDSEHCKNAIEAIIEGGIKFIEITATMNNAFELIEHFSKAYANQDVFIGAGTILDEVTARLAIMKGAKFIVAPCFNERVAEICNLYRVPYIPGVHNPQDIDVALRSGCDFLKLFPASTVESFVIKEFKGPFPQADFIISGKVNKQNLSAWLENGAVATCLGSALTNQIVKGKEAVLSETKSFIDIIHE